jgi:hypothetical protein
MIAVKQDGKSEAYWLRADLKDAIEAGEKAKILSKTTAQLSAAVQGYRNLIHPGRVVRLGETATQEGATVALALVKMVAKDIAEKRAKVYGLTAEQLVTKLEQDAHCTAYLPHLVKDMNETEKERLLLDVLPKRNYEQYQDQEGRDGKPKFTMRVAAAFRECFRHVREQVPKEVQRKILAQYVSILKEQTTAYRECYEKSFFVCSDLQGNATPAEIDIVKAHVLGLLNRGQYWDNITLAEGVGRFVTIEDVKSEAARALWRPVFNCDDEEGLQSFVNWFQWEFMRMEVTVAAAFVKDMEQQVTYLQGTGRDDLANNLQYLITNRHVF